MKVAIIGGGFAGLACAHELERLGVKPEIYEKKGFIGEPISHVTAVLEICHRPVRDALKYFEDELYIRLEPLNKINRLVHYSPNITMAVKGGNLGYLLENTASSTSIKQQLLRQLKSTRIVFNEEADPLKLKKDYDYVIIATGNYSIPNELGVWQEILQSYVRGALVQGSFDDRAVLMWINKDYCKNGYAYLTPFNKDRASLILVTTDISEKDIDHYWELFMYSENLRYPIVEEFRMEHRSGFVYPLTVENMILAGNAAGGLDPFLGFGHFYSIVSGVSAARSIVKGTDLEKQMKMVLSLNRDFKQFRKAFNSMSNKDYDKLLLAMKLPGVRTAMYNPPLGINYVKLGGAAGRLLRK